VASSTATLSPHVRAGKLRGLAVSSKQRLPAQPDVPTFIEAGLPEYDAGNWIGLAVPAGTPKAVIEKLHAEIVKIQDLPDVQKQMEARGATVEKMSAAEFGALMTSEVAKWSRVVREANVKAE
jgi:tripartite-type tricarboxylate transporter receptor subunit TctC